MHYRADIDGLRAVAIILVLIYHGGLTWLPAGFIGVDIFFVISGFLITSIIFGALNTGNFSFKTFYSRRLWRLQPVFLSLIFLLTVLSFILLLPDDLIKFSDSARKTSLFMSNLYFKKTTTGYFADDAHQLPLLHTWSLSIEWQCYLLLPLIMYVLHRFLGQAKVVYAVYSLLIILGLFAIYSSYHLPLEAYFLCSNRLFEFFLGASLAVLPLKPLRQNSFIINGLGLVALLGIGYIASREGVLPGYPNTYAFGVCAATAVLIALGTWYPSATIVRLLTVRPLVFIGLLSYSLYIWHWPFFALLKYEGIQTNSIMLMLTYAIIALVAYLSWRFIEKPSRRLQNMRFSYTCASLLLIPIALTHLNSYLIKQHLGYPQRFNANLVQIYQTLKQYSSADRPLCISKSNTDIEAHCKIGSSSVSSKKAFLIGDSYANHYWGFIDTLAKATGVNVLVQGTSSCLTLPGIYLFDWWYFKNAAYQECRDETERYYRMIAEQHYDYVLIGQIWANYYSDSVINNLKDQRSLALAQKRITEALDKAVVAIIASGAKPILIKSTPAMQDNFHDCVYKYIKQRKAYDPSYCSFKYQPTVAETWFDNLFVLMQTKYPQLQVIDPKSVQCKQGICPADIQGVPIYRDVGHITDFASYYFGEKYLREHANPFV